MTDTERKRIEAICEVAGVSDIEDLSDGSHTFRQLYYQRMMLFAAIVKQNKDKAWKSLRHENGELCFGGGWFVVGVDTPEGSYTYHYEDNYYSLFDCKELERGKHWDGHTEKDVARLLSLPSTQPEQKWIPFKSRPLTEEEKEDHPEWDFILDGKLPKDGQRILVNVKYRGHEAVQYDEYYDDDGCYLDSGYEIGTEVTAWMPLPKVYGGEPG